MSDSKAILKTKFIEHFLFDYTDKDDYEVRMLSEIFEGIYHQKDKHFKSESKYWQVFRCLADQQAIIDNLKAQLNNMEACYIEKKKQVEGLQGQLKTWKGQSLAAMLHGTCKCGEPWQSIISDREGFNLLHCFNCNNDRYENKEFFGDHEPKPLRGGHD